LATAFDAAWANWLLAPDDEVVEGVLRQQHRPPAVRARRLGRRRRRRKQLLLPGSGDGEGDRSQRPVTAVDEGVLERGETPLAHDVRGELARRFDDDRVAAQRDRTQALDDFPQIGLAELRFDRLDGGTPDFFHSSSQRVLNRWGGEESSW
jgi:hypothetical protein